MKIYTVIAGYFEETHKIFFSNDKEKSIEIAKKLWNKHKPMPSTKHYFGPWFSVTESDMDTMLSYPDEKIENQTKFIWSYLEEEKTGI